ncbi:AAA family ATPase, partial [Actinotignum timonense]
FSRGMTQRLGIALALVGAPRLLVLDEPTSALDPLGRADVLNIIRELAGRTTVLLTSHLLADVQQVCDHVGMLHEGTLLAEGPLDEVLALYRPERATVQVSVARADT